MSDLIAHIDEEIETIEAEQREIEARLTALSEAVNKLRAFRLDYSPPDLEREEPPERKSVPTGTVKRAASKPKPAPPDPQYQQKIIEALKAAKEPLSSAQLRAAAGIGQGRLVDVVTKLRNAGKIEKVGTRGPGVRYKLADGSPQPPADGRLAPLPPLERTQLQDRIVALLAHRSLTTTEIAKELDGNVLKCENSCKALEKRGEVVFKNGWWELA